MTRQDQLQALETQVPIEVETKYEITREEQELFVLKLVAQLHFQIVFTGIVTDSFTSIEESKVTHGKDFERYRHTKSDADGTENVVVNRKWWEVENGQDLRRETPDLPASLDEYTRIKPGILASLIKKRISMVGIVSGKPMHVDLDVLYDYDPENLPEDIASIPDEKSATSSKQKESFWTVVLLMRQKPTSPAF